MPEHSIELLGQKFSYPSTWQGAFSVLVVCAAISFIASTLEPDQIDSYRSLFDTQSSKQVEDSLVNLNEKLNDQIISLKTDVLRLTEAANLANSEKEEIVSKVHSADREIKEAYSGLIQNQTDRKNRIDEIISSADKQQQTILNSEKVRLLNQIDRYQRQQQRR